MAAAEATARHRSQVAARASAVAAAVATAKHAQGGAAHCPAPGLIEVDSGYLSATLDAKSGFE